MYNSRVKSLNFLNLIFWQKTTEKSRGFSFPCFLKPLVSLWSKVTLLLWCHVSTYENTHEGLLDLDVLLSNMYQQDWKSFLFNILKKRMINFTVSQLHDDHKNSDQHLDRVWYLIDAKAYGTMAFRTYWPTYSNVPNKRACTFISGLEYLEKRTSWGW